MFSKFSQQLKPLGKRSSSETKKDQSNQKSNLQITQKRQRSESRVHSNDESKQLIQSVPAQRMNLRLPDLIKQQNKIENSTSRIDLTKKPPLVKSRIIIDTKSKQQHQQQQIQMQSIPIKSQQEETFTFVIIKTKNKKSIILVNPDLALMALQRKPTKIENSVYNFMEIIMLLQIWIVMVWMDNMLVFDFLKIFFDIHQKMKLQTEFGCQFSGTTLTVILVKEHTIQCGWFGNSRAILVRRNQNLSIIELSIDHKPNLESERQRLESCGGVVDTYHLSNGAPIGPSRVWDKGAQFPGLAMYRSLGDLGQQIVNYFIIFEKKLISIVSQIPELKLINIENKEDLFIVLGSDGIWEFLDNQTIAELIYPFYQKDDPQGACQKLYKKLQLLGKFIAKAQMIILRQ
ncbi:unnamed protein product [Paramecium primaurelia]|uniref:PPM-type phosphatase domain-containing protein n=1 Tax=Paramecium primaurelia TaxID=5886 RepID=A0A8S1N3E9_PARPR|nr:unnamed protein product [Paramecium primaurelia]